MSTDVFYGQGSEIRVGVMANATTDPTTWLNLEYVRLSLSRGRERRDRPKMGVPLHNAVDDRRKVPGIERVSGDLVVPCDSRQLARWLRLGLGAPTTTGTGPLYTHTFNSGATDAALFALQVRAGANDVRFFRGLTISSVQVEAADDQVEDFDVRLGLVGLSRTFGTAFVAGTPTAAPATAECRRLTFHVNGTAAGRVVNASFAYDRRAAGKAFLSQNPVVSEVRPMGGSASGQVTFDATGRVYDDLEEADTLFAAKLRGFGVVANHQVDFDVPLSRFSDAPLSIDGPGIIRRTWSFNGEQDATTPVARVAITNDVASYAS